MVHPVQRHYLYCHGLFICPSPAQNRVETISQYLVLNYGKTVGSIASWVTTIGIFFSVVSSCLPGIGIICAVFDVSVWTAALILMLLVASYVFFGGMKSAGVGGILKMLILFASLFVAGGTAFWAIHTDPAISAALPDFPGSVCWGTVPATQRRICCPCLWGSSAPRPTSRRYFPPQTPRRQPTAPLPPLW